MSKKFYLDTAKRFLSLSVAHVFQWNSNHQFLNDNPDNNDCEKVSEVFFDFFSWKRYVVEPISKLSFGFSNRRTLTIHFTFQKALFPSYNAKDHCEFWMFPRKLSLYKL